MTETEVKKNTSSDEKIIPMIPIVFYVGGEKWTAVSKFHELVNIPNKLLKKFIPDFEYIISSSPPKLV